MAVAADTWQFSYACDEHCRDLTWDFSERWPGVAYEICGSPFRMTWKAWLTDCTPFSVAYYVWGLAVTAYWRTLGRRRLVLGNAWDEVS